MILLLWTVADLSNSSLCALESEGAGAFTAASSAPGGSVVTTKVPSQTPTHIDDCFCCSHCVDVQAPSLLKVAIAVDLERSPVVVAAPSAFASSLYHPPLG